MGRYSKLRSKILSGAADTNIEFTMLCQLLLRLGFEQRVKGSHVFFHKNVVEIINIQAAGNKAKPYQVKLVRDILVKYRLGEANVDEV